MPEITVQFNPSDAAKADVERLKAEGIETSVTVRYLDPHRHNIPEGAWEGSDIVGREFAEFFFLEWTNASDGRQGEFVLCFPKAMPKSWCIIPKLHKFAS